MGLCALGGADLKFDAEKEVCTICGKCTEYCIDTPVSERIGYIEGSGQLCRDCYYEIYTKKSDEIKFVES